MNFSGKNEAGHTLRIRPEVLWAIASLPDVRLVIEMEQAPVRASPPTNRFRFKIPFFGEGEAEGLFGIAALVTVLMLLAIVVLVLGRAQ
jgi:hypothetical protein